MRILFLLLLLPFVSAAQSSARKVLWIGNSYTYVNDLPSMLRQLALSSGDTLIMDSNTPGGYSFAAHTTNATTLQKLAQTGNDFVILQAQSQEPSFPPTQVESQTFPYASQLDSLIHVGSPCAQTVFYMTWGRKYGDAQNCPNYPPLCTFQGMNDRLRWAYKTMADNNEALLSPVGMAWKASWEADSTINLWSSDNSHPSVAGSYLSACVFYATLLKKSPVGLSYTAGLSSPQVQFLQQIADNTVFDSLSTWNIGRWDTQADFTYVLNGTTLSVTSQSQQANQFLWDFGDGQSSSEENPTHIYEAPVSSSYQVQLIASSNCNVDTSVQSVQLNPTGLTSMEQASQWRVYPNPASKEVMIQAVVKTAFDITIFSATGSVSRKYHESGTHISLNLEGLAPGMYQVVCTSGSDQKFFRIVKD